MSTERHPPSEAVRFTVRCGTRGSGPAVVEVEGALTGPAVGVLSTVVDDVRLDERVAFDLRRCDALDIAALAVIAEMVDSVRARGGMAGVTHATEAFHEAITAAGRADLLRLSYRAGDLVRA
jgi:ABC-type transporter Mla MlaB component